MADDRNLLTVAEAAKRLRLSKSKVYELIDNDDLVAVKIGRSRRIDPKDLDDFIRRHRTGPDSPAA